MRVYSCRYVRHKDPGDLLWGYHWRPAVIVDTMPHEGELFRQPLADIEECMFDADTGENVGDTRNFCIDPECEHEDCAPLTLLVEVQDA